MSNKASIKTKLEEEVAHFIATGEADLLGSAFPGNSIVDRLTGYDRHLRNVLLQEVRIREHGRRPKHVPPDFAPATWTQRKVRPMITGLFPKAEQHVLLDMAARSIVFLTRNTTHRLIKELDYLSSAWSVANMYLYSLRASLLGDGCFQAVGLSEGTKCYVSLEYFTEDDPFADYNVHEVAHTFHNCKRETLGVPSSRSKEWLLNIDFAKRETFAYACEFYSRILELSRSPAQRCELFEQFARRRSTFGDLADRNELLDILKDAVVARNGWKRIMTRCSSRKPSPRSLVQQQADAGGITA